MSFTDTVSRHVLPNGLTVLLQSVPASGVIAVATHVRAGYFDEPDEWAGIAHVLEHMFFKGTRRRGPGEIARETQLLGGYLNASTIYDKTVYVTVLPAAHGALERALDIQADALTDCALAPHELSRELEVIIQEAKRKLDSPRALTTETLYELVFRVHRMRRWRIGTEAGLRRLTAGDVRAYYETRYRPDRVILAVVGKLDPVTGLALVRQRYAGWSRPVAPLDTGPAEPAERSPGLRVLTGDVSRPLASLGWRTVNALHADAPALDVAAMILGSGRGARLWREVRGPGLASGVSASHYTPTEVGVFEVALECEPARAREAVTQSLDTVTRLADQPPGEAELDRVRALLAAQWAKQIESMDGRAALLTEFEALRDYRLADAMLERTLAVTADDVARVARAHLAREAACGVLYVREHAGAGLAESEWPPPDAGERLGTAVKSFAQPAPVATPAAALRKRGRRVGRVVRVAADGAHLLAGSRPGAGLVSLSLGALGLRDHETEETAGLTALLVRTALRGAGGMNAEQLAVAAESLGGAVAATVGTEVAGFSLTVPSACARAAARLLVTIVREPLLAEADIATERELLATDAARARDDMFGHPLQAVLRQAFAGHAYGLPTLGDPECVHELNPPALREHAERLRAAPAVFVACGDLPERELLAVLEAAWADGNGSRASRRQPRAPGWRPSHGAEQRDKAQTALALAFPAPPTGSDQRFALEVLCAYLGGLAGRLFRTLRDERSLAYTVSALPWLRRRAGAVLTYIATSPEREDEARSGLLEELAQVGADPPPVAELERARNYAAGLVLLRRERVAAWAGEILEAHVNRLLADLNALPDRLRAVGAREVGAVAQAVFQAARAAEYVVRGAGKSR
ncbi:MAG: insulinase family protein [Gemmatimonadetes bacterium]|nr:insulinase family protein [Gemmatimonadota bacterium]